MKEKEIEQEIKELMKEKKPEKEPNPAKVKLVKNLVGLIKKSKSFLVVSVKNIPGKQFQEIKKKLVDKVKLKVVKKSLIIRAIEQIGGDLSELKKYKFT